VKFIDYCKQINKYIASKMKESEQLCISIGSSKGIKNWRS